MSASEDHCSSAIVTPESHSLCLRLVILASVVSSLVGGACAGRTPSLVPGPSGSQTDGRPNTGKGVLVGILKSSCQNVPLQGAAIALRSGSPNLPIQARAQTDSNGMFVFGSIVPG